MPAVVRNKYGLKKPHDTARFIADLKQRSLPLVVTLREGEDRTSGQNNLAHKWFGEAANWLGDQEPWEVRAECKLNIGIRMLVSENEDFRDKWTRLIRDRFTYEEKLELMVEPHDYPVTRIMSAKQMGHFMDTVWKKYTDLGVPLTRPQDQQFTGSP